jgi:hypothetical protein
MAGEVKSRGDPNIFLPPAPFLPEFLCLSREQLVIGDLSPSQPLEHLVRATQTIFPSLLEREAAQHGWGDLVNQVSRDELEIILVH